MTLGALIWLSLAILLGMIEGMTAGLVSIWFAGGAVTAFIIALLGGGFVLQIVVFVVASAILLGCMRSLTRKKILVETIATNADRILGRLAVVSEPIDNLKATGAVRIDGVEWTARCESENIISAGETVKILQIDGVKVVVEPASQPVDAEKPAAQPAGQPEPAAGSAEPAASAS
ncbi:MAG: NfeD family protein [Oscillospiraceae bacterium]|nr:NfeD family protein [Oscillospiraceae bacterium]